MTVRTRRRPFHRHMKRNELIVAIERGSGANIVRQRWQSTTWPICYAH